MKKSRWLSLGVVLLAVAVGCGDDDGDSGGEGGSASTSSSAMSSNGSGGGGTGGAGGSSSSGAGGMAACDIPLNGGAELQAFLDAGNYSGWNAESGPHDSAGPHFGDVRTFVNDVLFTSLQDGNSAHPRCAAAVKELYGSGSTVLGHAVMVKLQDDSDGGQGWYWYEFYQGTTYADGPGDSLCTGCHSSGSDYVRTPFPLQ